MSNVGRIAAQAANTLTTPLNVEDVFSTYLYTGNGSTQTITNGIDLAGEGGLVWIKNRSRAVSNALQDTERGYDYLLKSDATTASTQYGSSVGGFGGFNSDGFDLIADAGGFTYWNYSGDTYASWTFRKAPKFFDVVTYTGNDGNTDLVVNHNLGTTVGTIIVKDTSTTSDWYVWHRSLPTYNFSKLNLTNASSTSAAVFKAVTDTSFTLGGFSGVNTNGNTFVAYLFAHNNGDGDFGDGTQDIIKCGSWTGAGATEVSVSLGFEPQWLLVKKTSATDDWYIIDNMRGQPFGANVSLLSPNTASAEQESLIASPTPDGLITKNWSNGQTYIYIAIRRGPMAVPESATDVFAIDTQTSGTPNCTSGFVIDAATRFYLLGSASYPQISSRLTSGYYLKTSSTDIETSLSSWQWDMMDGYGDNIGGTSTDLVSHMWKRAPSFFDVVAYTGNGVAGRTVSHNLGVAPEMMWVKQRDAVRSWVVYRKDISETEWLYLNSTGGVIDNTANVWNDTRPTDSVFYLSSNQLVNLSGGTYIAYLFASLNGVSKVGSYTGNGTSQNINCGFSSGARFILIKRKDSTGDWYVWDAERGIVSANDPHLSLNTTAAQVTTDDSVDPVSSGFAVNQVAATNINVSSASYIFYAIA